MNVVETSPIVSINLSNPAATVPTTDSYITIVESIHKAIDKNQPDIDIIENLIESVCSYFPMVEGLFLFDLVNGEIDLTSTRSLNASELAEKKLFTIESFEACIDYEYLDIDSVFQNKALQRVQEFLKNAKAKTCLLIPIVLHQEVNAVFGIFSTFEPEWQEEHCKIARSLFWNLYSNLQKRSRTQVQALLQEQLLEPQEIDQALSQLANRLLETEDGIFQIQIIPLESEYATDFHVYGQNTEFENFIKEKFLNQGKYHISFNKTLENAVNSKTPIYTPDVSLDPNWNGTSETKTKSIMYFPLFSHGKKVIGVFCAISKKVNGFSEADQLFLGQVVGTVNLIFQNQFRILDLEENVMQLEQLASVSQRLKHTISIEEAQLQTLNVITQKTSASRCLLLTYEKDFRYFSVQAKAKSTEVTLSSNERLFADNEVLKHFLTIDSHDPIHFVGNTYDNFKPYERAFNLYHKVEHVILFPISFDGDQLKEFALVGSDTEISSSNKSLITAAIGNYTNCKSRINSVTKAKSEAESYKKLARFGATIEELQNFDELIEFGTRQLMSIFNIGDAYYYEFKDNYNTAVSIKSWGAEIFQSQEFDVPKETTLGMAISTKEIVYVKDYCRHEYHKPEVATQGLKSVLFLPIKYGNTLVGCMALHGMYDIVDLRESDLDLARQFLSRLRNALERRDYVGQLEHSREETLRSLGIVLEHRDLETQGHTNRVIDLARNFAMQLQLSDKESKELLYGACLHDIGKLAIPDRILLKPGKLTTEEFEEIKLHTVHGFDMASKIPLLPEASSLLVKHHHEQWQGSGYPHNLEGDGIPVLARMFSLIDVYDALRSKRPYKEPWTKEASFTELRDQKGIMFDPALVEEFIVVADGYDKTYEDFNRQIT